jgi:hypothetical protein
MEVKKKNGTLQNFAHENSFLIFIFWGAGHCVITVYSHF